MSSENKKPGLLSGIESGAIAGVIETILPKIKPLIGPAIEKVNEFLGNNDKIIILRALPGQKPQLIILNNSGDYSITSSSIENKQTFDVFSKETVHGVFDVSDFINLLLTGEIIQK